MLTRYRTQTDPFADLFRLQNALWSSVARPEPRVEGYAPPVDLWEDQDAYWVEAELPGVKAEDVDIDLEENVLTLKGERRLERSTEEEGYRHTERVYGKFTRAFRLPESVDADQVEADLADGVLKIRLPKKPEAKARKIEVKAHGKQLKAAA